MEQARLGAAQLWQVARMIAPRDAGAQALKLGGEHHQPRDLSEEQGEGDV